MNVISIYGSYQHRKHAYVLTTPVLLDSLDSVVGWTATGGVVLPVGALVQGTGSLQVTGDGIATGQYITATATLDPSTFKTVSVCCNIQPPIAADLTSVSMYFGQGATNMQINYNTPPFRKGKRWLAANVPYEGAALAALGSANTTKRLKGNELFTGAKNCVTTWDALYYNCAGRPTVVLTFDDNYLSHYATVFPLMQNLGLKGTLYIPPGFVGSGNNHATLLQLQEMYAAGWDMGVDIQNDQPYTPGGGYANDAASTSDMHAIYDYLVANNMPRAKNHLAYPNGTWSESLVAAMDTAGIIFSARTKEPQSVFDRFGIGDIAKTTPAMAIGGATTVAAVTAQVDLIIARGATQFFYAHDINEASYTASTTSGSNIITVTSIESGKIMAAQNIIGTGIPASTNISNYLMGTGGTGIYHISQNATATNTGVAMSGTPSAIGQTTTKFSQMLAYLVAKRDAGLLDILTVSQWWARASIATIP